MLLDVASYRKESDWLKLPNELWEHICSYLDRRSLISASETCVKLRCLIDETPKITDKLWMTLYKPEEGDEKFIEGLKVVLKSRRRYKQLFIQRVKSEWFRIELFVKVLKHLGESVQALATDCVKFSTRQDFIKTLRLFPNLRRLQLKLVVIDGEKNPEMQCLGEKVYLPQLADLYLVEYYPWICDILSNSVNIQRLESYIIKWTENDPRAFENLLFRQKSLKKLRLGIFRQGRLFKSDRSNEIQFQMEKLNLNGALFASKENLFKFIQSQRRLRKVQMTLVNEFERRLDESLFYNDILKYILCDLPELKAFGVNQERFKFPNLDFLTSLPPNNNIVDLRIENESKDIFTALVTSVLPNIKHLSYEANLNPSSVPDSSTINQMQNLESLIMDKFFVECLTEIHLPKLTSFEFVARWSCDDFKGSFRIFLQRHRLLKRLRIGIVKFMADLSVSMDICNDMIANLTQLESLNIQNFDDINPQIDHLVNNMGKLQIVEVSSEQFKLIACATFDECSVNGVSIAIGK